MDEVVLNFVHFVVFVVSYLFLLLDNLVITIEVTNKAMVNQRVIGYLIDVITKLWVVIMSIM